MAFKCGFQTEGNAYPTLRARRVHMDTCTNLFNSRPSSERGQKLVVIQYYPMCENQIFHFDQNHLWLSFLRFQDKLDSKLNIFDDLNTKSDSVPVSLKITRGLTITVDH